MAYATSDKARIKRTMAEIRCGDLGIITCWDNGKGLIRLSRNSIYKRLREVGYEWNAKYTIWVKV